MGRLHQRMPVGAAIHRRMLIGHNEQDIRSIHYVLPALEKSLTLHLESGEYMDLTGTGVHTLPQAMSITASNQAETALALFTSIQLALDSGTQSAETAVDLLVAAIQFLHSADH